LFKRIILIAAAIAGVAAVPTNAAIYQLHYTGSGATTADLRLRTANTAVAGSFAILGVSGTVNGDVVTGLAPVNPPGFTTDNRYFATDPILTSGGVGFFSATATYNLWDNSPGSYSLYGTTNGGGSYVPASDGTLSIAAVPEPALWGLMIVGFGLTGIAARRRTAAVAA
jgi:hypothetical protein